MAYAKFAGISKLQGIDSLVPVAARSAGVGIKPRHESLGANKFQLGLEGRLLIAFHQGDSFLALIGEEKRDRYGAEGIALAGGSRATVPAQMQSVAVGPRLACKAPVSGDFEVA